MLRSRQSRSLVTAIALLGACASAPFLASALAPTPPAAASAGAASASAKMAAAAQKWLASLGDDQRALAAFAWDDPTRVDWHFIPKERTGLPLKKMTPPQRKLAHELLKTGLSQAGYRKATQIVALESVLAEMEKNPVKRDPELYYVSLFGTPDPKGTWGWRWEGHHTSLNFTVVKGTLLATSPSFMGTNPAEVRQGPLKGRRVLGAEEDLARGLLMSFDEEQRKVIVHDPQAPADILTAAQPKVEPLAAAGLPASAFSPKQKAMLRRLLNEYAANMPPALAAARLARVEQAGFEKLHFAWAGGLRKGDPHYYRIQGPTVLIEYDNTQNEANHAHSVWRDFDGDFGRDLIREHLTNVAH
jgi:hypothetical protein